MTATTRLDVLRNMLDMSMRQAAIGARIRIAREDKKLKQRQLAAQIPGRDGPIDAQTISRWERGVHKPDFDSLEVIAEITGKPMSFFLENEEATPNGGRVSVDADRFELMLDHLGRLVELLEEERRLRALGEQR